MVEDVLGNEADEFQTVVVQLGANYPGARHVVWLDNPRNGRLDSLSSAPSNVAMNALLPFFWTSDGRWFHRSCSSATASFGGDMGCWPFTCTAC